LNGIQEVVGSIPIGSTRENAASREIGGGGSVSGATKVQPCGSAVFGALRAVAGDALEAFGRPASLEGPWLRMVAGGEARGAMGFSSP
jgi:hypothetical protein